MKKGFTLIELILALAIITLILSIAWIRLEPLGRMGEKAEVRQILRDIQFTRNAAITSGKKATFRITSNTTYVLFTKNEQIGRSLDRVSFQEKIPFEINYLDTSAPQLNFTLRVNGKTKKYTITSTVATGKVQIVEE